jgi:signal transduction histidine kinase
LAHAGAQASPGPVVNDGHQSIFGLAIGPPVVPAGVALYEQIHIDPFIAISASEAAPFQDLRAAVYATRTPAPRSLVLSNSRSLPVTGEVSEVPVDIGSGTWWLVASARAPLAGRFPNAAPLVVLLFGLVLAVAFGCIVEILKRRQRYADLLVNERTAALLASQEALVRSERLSAMGQMTTVVGHEMRNPLGAVVQAHYLLRRSLRDPEAAEKHLAVAERQTAKAVSLAQDLIEYMRDRPPVLAPVKLGEVLGEVLETSPTPENISLTQQGMSIVLQADFGQLVQILSNILDNAYQAMPNGGVISLVADVEGSMAVIRVENSDSEIDAAISERIFEPFFTTRPDGTGLGLAIVRRLAEAHGGSVSVENAASGGVVVTIRLPREPAR